MRCVALLPLLPLVLGSPADQPVPLEKPPPERWRETSFQLDWPAPKDAPNPWGCRAGRGARVVLDRVRTLRDKPRTDTVQVWLSFMNGSLAACYPPSPRMFTDRGLQRDEPLRLEGGWTELVEPRQSGRSIVAGAVPIGTRALWLTARESPLRLRIDLERGSAELVSPEGTVVASAEGRERAGTPDPHPSYVRIPVGERFPGVSMVQADGRDGCSRYYDLGIDDLYLVRGVERNHAVRDELVLDATFYRLAREPSSTPDCKRHVSLTGRYAHLQLHPGFTQPGAEPDSRVATFGARQLRRFELEPDTARAVLIFGDPGAASDVLAIDLEQRAASVVKRSAALGLKPDRDLLSEWLERDRDMAKYLLRKFVRGQSMRTDPEPRLSTEAAACDQLERLGKKGYVPGSESEPLRETFRVLCPQAADGGW
ncbi:MAG TPA: hypothetical protein VFA20_23435 [Myxococcaceae bacterium]|nr:hypothetical protein [Myxococcaceae bacterium]